MIVSSSTLQPYLFWQSASPHFIHLSIQSGKPTSTWDLGLVLSPKHFIPINYLSQLPPIFFLLSFPSSLLDVCNHADFLYGNLLCSPTPVISLSHCIMLNSHYLTQGLLSCKLHRGLNGAGSTKQEPS